MRSAEGDGHRTKASSRKPNFSLGLLLADPHDVEDAPVDVAAVVTDGAPPISLPLQTIS